MKLTREKIFFLFMNGVHSAVEVPFIIIRFHSKIFRENLFRSLESVPSSTHSVLWMVKLPFFDYIIHAFIIRIKT